MGVPQLQCWSVFFGGSRTHELPKNVLRPCILFTSQCVTDQGIYDPNYWGLLGIKNDVDEFTDIEVDRLDFSHHILPSFLYHFI